jgi:putative colanic acid biosynthesis UDP-glucose lipid carrier transferase
LVPQTGAKVRINKNEQAEVSVAAVVGPITASTSAAEGHRRVRFGNVEPALLALLKQLDPVVVVATLFGCMVLSGEHFSKFYAGVALLAFVISWATFSRPGSDSSIVTPRLAQVYSYILLQWCVVAAILLFLAFAFKVSSDFSRVVMLSWFCATPFTLFAVRGLRLRVHSFIANSAAAPRYIVIGANNVAYELLRRLPQRGFLGFFDFRSADRVSQWTDGGDKLIGHCHGVTEFVRSNGVSAIYIALPLSNVPRIGEMIRELRDTTASIYFLPDVFAFDLIQGRLVNIDGMPALSVCDTPFHGTDAVLKRVFDVVLSGVAVVVLAPLMAALAIGVKLSSPGPALFRQRRYGLHGEEIAVYKFRSMVVCEDGAAVTQATRDDPRITRFGRFLRRTSLDELPQLLNVLEGKMSLVGPRPHAVAHNELYRKLICGYMIRHKVRPGISGWAQVNGLRGETDTVDKMSARVKFDIDYLNQWSIWLDIKILVRTVLLVVRDRRAY